MLELSEDYKRLLNHLGVEEINLLRFLNDDSYPVPSRMVSRRWIDHFPQLAPAEQRYALFTRYTALLVDPYSEPDAQGRYYDFSAVRVTRVFQNAQGLWCLPRVPLEDVRKLRALVLLAERRRRDAHRPAPVGALSAGAAELRHPDRRRALPSFAAGRYLRRTGGHHLPSVAGASMNQGALLAIFASLIFSVMNALVKTIADDIPTGKSCSFAAASAACWFCC